MLYPNNSSSKKSSLMHHAPVNFGILMNEMCVVFNVYQLIIE